MGARVAVPGVVVLVVVASLAMLGLSALPAAAAPGRTAAPAADHSNVGAPHSPQLLRQLAGPVRPLGTGTTGPAASVSVALAGLAGAAQGVDVASFQHPSGAAINWTQVYTDGIRFAAVKATEGAYYHNPYALTDLTGARSAGLTVAAYAFAIPNGNGSSSSPTAQADYLLSYLGPAASSTPVMLDIEYNPYGAECYGLSTSAMVAWIAGFDNEIKAKTGRLPIIYTPPAWWSTCTGGSGAFGQAPVWVPSYTSSTSPALPAGWGTWNLWQYTSSGTVSGIATPGATDLDQLNPAVITLLNAGNRASVAGSAIWQQQVTPFTVSSAPALTFSATGLPAGLTVNPATGQISGWPDTPGTYQAAVSASDANGTTGAAPFTWTVSAAPGTGPTGPIRLDLGGKCLDDSANATTNGNKIDIWTCNNTTAQNWTLVQDSTLRIHGKCLDVYHSGTTSGTRVDLYSCNGTGAQHWRVATGGELVNPHSSMCLTDPASSTTNGTQVQIQGCTGSTSQKWTLPAGPAASGIAGKCLDDSANSTTNGNKIDIWTCNNTTEQNWIAEPDGTVRIHGKCLDVYHSGTTSGTRVDLYSCNGTAAQQWNIVASGAGSTLVNPQSGLCLADPGDSTVNGTGNVIATCTAAAGQAWRAR
jgi:GH25 family lysozyme M1 (1,4-beta-N-acetylmuramidase)/3D (Asp-Asp-Asp) domain-containing protein